MVSYKELFKLLNKCKNQFFVAICVNFSTVSCGSLIGWCSPALVILRSTDSTLTSGPINVVEASWIASCHYIGEACGIFLFGVIGRRFGQKFAITVTGVMYALSWCLILYGNNVTAILIGKSLAGLACGGSVLCIPLLIADIADNEIRGVLGSILAVTFQIGITLSYIAGSYLSYNNMIYTLLVFPILLCLGMLVVPESPQFLLGKNQANKAVESLKFYKNYATVDSDEFKMEIQKMEKYANKKNEPTERIRWQDFFERKTFHGLIISTMLMVFLVCSGLIISISYGATILKESGSDWDANKSTIVMGLVQVFGTACSLMAVDVIGRRILLTISLSGCTIGLLVLGGYLYCGHFDSEILASINWIPVVTLSIILLASTIGIAPIPFFMMTEVLPDKLRAAGSMMCLFIRSVLLFIILKMYPVVAALYGTYVIMWLFSAISFVGIFFCIYFVPETKGKAIN